MHQWSLVRLSESSYNIDEKVLPKQTSNMADDAQSIGAIPEALVKLLTKNDNDHRPLVVMMCGISGTSRADQVGSKPYWTMPERLLRLPDTVGTITASSPSFLT